MTSLFKLGSGAFIVVLALAAAGFGQNPPAQPPQEKPAEKKAPVKRVRVDMSGFELGQAPPPKSSTQLGGGTRSMGGDTTPLAPAIGRCYTEKPVLAWTHSASVQAFTVELFQEGGAAAVHRLRVAGRQTAMPAEHALEPGESIQWRAAPESALLGGPSAKSTIRRLTDAELNEVTELLKKLPAGESDPLVWRAQVFTDKRVWYDAIAAWSELIGKYPDRADLREKRGQIYDQLPATVPLADADFATAEKLRAR